MSDYYFNAANVQERFSIRVDWDIDEPYGGVEGCHGRDLIFDDDPQEVEFSIFNNGDVTAKFGDSFPWENVVLRKDNTLLSFRHPRIFFALPNPFAIRLESLQNLPAHYVGKGGDHVVGTYWGRGFSADQIFYQCYQESQNLNQHLTDMQKGTVDRFFEAVKTTFPKEFQ